MSIYTFLKQEHEEILSMIKQTSTKNSQVNIDMLFSDLKKKITIHSKAEEKAFYIPLKKYNDLKDLINHAADEHEEVDRMLKKLEGKSLNDEEWFELFTKMVGSLLHHIDEEEGKLFDKVKDKISPELADKFEKDMKAEMIKMEAVLGK